MLAIFKREFKSYFTSMTGYAFAAFLLLFAGIYTMSVCLVGYFANFEYAIGNMTFIFLLIVPILTMKVFAEERKQKTDQLLYALPLSMTKIVAGKYLALLGVMLVPIAVISVYPLILSMYGNVSLKISLLAVFGFFLLGAALISIGMFISSMTESLPMAAGISFLVILLNYFLPSFATYLPAGSELLSSLSLFNCMDDFVYGLFDLGNIVFLISVAGLFFFLTVQSLEKRRWS
ncbi:MAG: ABC transporter permease subunit [Firmicutes bacterium]|nr:ABC transporter permease subunit [Bacillota bacterium]